MFGLNYALKIIWNFGRHFGIGPLLCDVKNQSWIAMAMRSRLTLLRTPGQHRRQSIRRTAPVASSARPSHISLRRRDKAADHFCSARTVTPNGGKVRARRHPAPSRDQSQWDTRLQKSRHRMHRSDGELLRSGNWLRNREKITKISTKSHLFFLLLLLRLRRNLKDYLGSTQLPIKYPLAVCFLSSSGNRWPSYF